MDHYTYYFINHTRKEFYFLTNKISICKAISDSLQNNIGWVDTDNIHIGSEKSSESTCIEYLDTIKYTFAKRINEY